MFKENEEMESSELERTEKKNKCKLKPFLGVAAATVLAGSVALVHERHTVNDLEDMCPISQIYYDLGNKQRAYEHQISHYYKSCRDELNCGFEYRPEKYIPPEGYTMNEDGKTCYITDDPIKIYKNGEYFYIAPEGYVPKGDQCIKTIDANYQCEGIIINDTMGNTTSMVIYDEEQKKLVKM